MADKGCEHITAFDSSFTTNQIQMLKILLTRLSPASQGGFAVYIKFLELQYTMGLSRTRRRLPLQACEKPLSAVFFDGDTSDTLELLDELLPFGGPEEQKRIEGLKKMLQSINRMKEMMEMMQMMKELFPDGFGEDGQNPADILSGLSGMGGMDMSGMDLSALFEMFGGNAKS